EATGAKLDRLPGLVDDERVDAAARHVRRRLRDRARHLTDRIAGVHRRHLRLRRELIRRVRRRWRLPHVRELWRAVREHLRLLRLRRLTRRSRVHRARRVAAPRTLRDLVDARRIALEITIVLTNRRTWRRVTPTRWARRTVRHGEATRVSRTWAPYVPEC